MALFKEFSYFYIRDKEIYFLTNSLVVKEAMLS